MSSKPPLVGKKTLPDAAQADADLSRGQARAGSLLLFRIVALSILVVSLCAEIPGLRPYRSMMESVSGVLALWPFFTACGRLSAHRIRLGQLYVEKQRWDDADRLLGYYGRGYRARLFDAGGEGRYLLAVAYVGLKKKDAAESLLRQIIAEIGERTEWGRRAAEISISSRPTNSSEEKTA